MKRAKYSVKHYPERNRIQIKELGDLTDKSVTNDLENIIDDITDTFFKENKKAIMDTVVLYEDSEGIWDEAIPVLDHNGKCIEIIFKLIK